MKRFEYLSLLVSRLYLLPEAHLLVERDGPRTVVAALNYGDSLIALKRLQEAESLLRKTIPVARRVLGSSDITTLRMRHNYAEALYKGGGATLDELREVVTTVEDTERIARRVFGGAHPFTAHNERTLRNLREVLRARETPSPGSA